MKKFDHKKIEKYWQAKWQKEKVYEPNLKSPRGLGKFYNLMMFPYPSAEGLHVGNMYAFVGSDIYGRYQRMLGKDVFEPIGLDGFGIHSENYALKIGVHPAKQAKISQKRFYKQLETIGNGFAWNEKVETYDPEYYKWTQWLFIQMFKNGLAYRKKQPVNWCPSCLTVLADEQVIGGPARLNDPSEWHSRAGISRSGGECERCGTKVIKKELEQWFFKITKYADRLLKNLEKIDPVRGRPAEGMTTVASGRPASNGIDWSEKIKVAQENWIGKSEGALIKFKIKDTSEFIEVFTTRPDTLLGVTYMVLSLEHELMSQLKNKISNWEEVKSYISQVKTKTKNERELENKEKTGVPLKGIMAINPASQKMVPVWVADYVLSGYGTGSIMAVPAYDERDAEFAKKFGLPIDHAPLVEIDEIIPKVNGKKIVQYRLRDWLISRQRYWGPPIPMIFCERCNWQPVPEKDLPVILPKIENFRPTGTAKSPLASVEKFYKVKCPNCGGEARRETDVSDTFLDSAWYYLGYLGIKFENSKSEIRNSPFSNELVKRWCPIDMYIGGAEHAVLHLLYVRFVAMALHDWGFIDFEEPATKFRAHGLIIKNGAKMSKSKGNVINPDEYIKNYGADALRMYLMFLGPFEDGGDFRDEGISGITRFLNRVWSICHDIHKIENSELNKKLHQAIKKIGEDISNLKYNTAISGLMIALREMEETGVSRHQLEIFLKLLAPFAPHLTEEVWRNVFKNEKSIHIASWPEYDATLLTKKTINWIVQINGRVRATLSLDSDLDEETVKKFVLENQNIVKQLAGKSIQKVIFIPNRLLNFVV